MRITPQSEISRLVILINDLTRQYTTALTELYKTEGFRDDDQLVKAVCRLKRQRQEFVEVYEDYFRRKWMTREKGLVTDTAKNYEWLASEIISSAKEDYEAGLLALKDRGCTAMGFDSAKAFFEKNNCNGLSGEIPGREIQAMIKAEAEMMHYINHCCEPHLKESFVEFLNAEGIHSFAGVYDKRKGLLYASTSLGASANKRKKLHHEIEEIVKEAVHLHDMDVKLGVLKDIQRMKERYEDEEEDLDDCSDDNLNG